MIDFLEDAFLYSIAVLYFCVIAFALGMVVGYLI
jgi:hypothetical protein